MYNPYGTFRSWLSNALVLSVASRIYPEYTLMVNILTAEAYMNNISHEVYEQRFDELIKEYGSTVGGIIKISACSLFLFLSLFIHETAHFDMCLELTRLFLKVTDK